MILCVVGDVRAIAGLKSGGPGILRGVDGTDTAFRTALQISYVLLTFSSIVKLIFSLRSKAYKDAKRKDPVA